MAANAIPDELPRPWDDGAADHLVGTGVPNVVLSGTDGTVDLGALPGTAVLYCYPSTAAADGTMPSADWADIPGARGCTPQSCAFRDHATDLSLAGADHIHGISIQTIEALSEAKERLELPYALLSDENLTFANALQLPTFEAEGRTFLHRLTLILRDGTVVKAFYPVFPPDRNAMDVLEWLRANRG